MHVLTDGRDVPDGSSLRFISELEAVLAELAEAGCDGKIASGGGRMGVTMDRCEWAACACTAGELGTCCWVIGAEYQLYVCFLPFCCLSPDWLQLLLCCWMAGISCQPSRLTSPSSPHPNTDVLPFFLSSPTFFLQTRLTGTL